MFTFDDIDMIWFANLKVADLKAELKKRGFKGYSKMKKAELQKALVDIMRAEREAEIEEETPSDEEMETVEEELEEEEVEKFNMEEELKDFARGITEDVLKGNIVIPVEGNEDKVKRMLRDLSMMYHPDRPTGDSEMMAFVNEIKEYIRIKNKGD